MSTAPDALNLARSQLGVCENPMGSNSGTPYHAWYGRFCEGWQWCAIFVTWVLFHVDPALFWALMTAYSGDYLSVGRMYLRGIDISQIAPGDICIWDRPPFIPVGITDHIGFVESITPTTFTTIEGNSGDCVKRNPHDRVQTSACHYYFVRPNYSSTPTPQPKPKTKETTVALVTSGTRVLDFGAIFFVGQMGGEPWDVWAKVQNPTAAAISVDIAATSDTDHKVKTITVQPNKTGQVQAGTELAAKNNTLVEITSKVPVVMTFDHRPTK